MKIISSVNLRLTRYPANAYDGNVNVNWLNEEDLSRSNLPSEVSQAIRGCILWMELSTGPHDVHSLAIEEGTMRLPFDFKLEYRAKYDTVTIVAVHAPVRST